MQAISWLQAAIMGLVQGLTEFLPVSSSGHLVLAKFILGANTDTSALFEVLLHVGTLAAVIAVYYKDVWNLIKEGVLLVVDAVLWVVRKKEFRMYPERRMVLMVILVSIPTAVLGLLVEKFLEDIFLSSILAVGIALLITGAVLLLTKRIPTGRKKLEGLKTRDALFIGLVQGVATIPGISRSGSTIAAGLFCGMNREAAIRFSFLISLPAIAGAAVLKLLKVSSSDLALNIGPYLFGTVIAALVGYLCIRWLLNLLKKNQFHYFGYYCLAVGCIAILWAIF